MPAETSDFRNRQEAERAALTCAISLLPKYQSTAVGPRALDGRSPEGHLARMAPREPCPTRTRRPAGPRRSARTLGRAKQHYAITEAVASQREEIRLLFDKVMEAGVTKDQRLLAETIERVNKNLSVWIAEPSQCMHPVAALPGAMSARC